VAGLRPVRGAGGEPASSAVNLSDPQASRLYAWERASVPDYLTSPLFPSLAEATRLLHTVWRIESATFGFAPEPPRLHFVSRHGPALAKWSSYAIELPPWARRRGVLLHETAHFLTGFRGHGSLFLSMFIALLARYNGCELSSLIATSRAAGLALYSPFLADVQRGSGLRIN